MQQRGFVGALAGACTSDGQAIMVGQPVRLLGEAGRREFLVVNLLVFGRGGAEAALMRMQAQQGTRRRARRARRGAAPQHGGGCQVRYGRLAGGGRRDLRAQDAQ